MKIHPNDLVLEVGSGNNPRSESSILTDRFLFDDSQRAGAFAVVVDRPFVVADGFRLPFKDNAFDYVICSHVIEHLEDPHAFVKELMRVGKRGYIEVPSILSERLFGWNFHLWYCEFKNNTLTLTRKNEGERFGGFFHRCIAHSLSMRRFHQIYEKKFYIKYEWNKKINISVVNKKKSQQELEKIDQHLWHLMSYVDWSWSKDTLFFLQFFITRVIKKILKTKRYFLWNLRLVINKNSHYKKILPLLICPQCHKSSLVVQSAILLCMSCKEKFVFKKHVPILLTKKELQKGY